MSPGRYCGGEKQPSENDGKLERLCFAEGSSDTKFKPVRALREFRPHSVIIYKVSREARNLDFY